jgi:hypothetical protein
MKNEDNQIDFVGGLKYLEDAENMQLPVDDKTITDSELEQAGLVKTSAFVRTKKSKNALRIAKHKDKKLNETGVKQLNIEVPDQFRDVFKAIAKELKETGTITKTQLDVLPFARTGEKTKQPTAETPQSGSKGEKVISDVESIELTEKVLKIARQGGFKAFLLKLIV